jgi:hypothetical protein
MARACSICSSQQAAQINVALAGGSAIAEVAAEYRNSESAVRRHAANHLSGALIRDRYDGTTTTTDLLERLQEALRDVDRVRAAALATGRGELAIKAAVAARPIIETLMLRVGIDDLHVLSLLQEGEVLALAVGRLARQDPSFGQALALQLDGAGSDDMADTLRSVSNQHALTTTGGPK